MISVAKMLDAAKAKHNLPSDYKLALVLGISQTAVAGYRKGKSLPDERVITKICELTGDDAGMVAIEMQAARAQNPESKALWEGVLSKLQRAANDAILSVLCAIVLIAAYAPDTRAEQVQTAQSRAVNFLYIVSNVILSGMLRVYHWFSPVWGMRWGRVSGLVAGF